MTVGILAEKPSAARAFAAALGGPSGTYNGIDYVIANARGHLYELAEPEAQLINGTPAEAKEMQSWNLDCLPWDLDKFAWKYVPMKGTSDMLKDIKSKFAKCDEVIVATDVDPSGEGGLIFANIAIGLGLTTRKLSRMYFTDEAPASLQKAFVSRKVIPDIFKFDEYLMASYRSAFDFSSIQFTRVATKSAGQQAVLRQGRLKSAMVNLVGAQLEAHSKWIKIPEFQNRFRDDNDVLYTNPAEPRFATEAEVPQGYTASKVVLDARTNKSTAPRRLLDLAGLAARLSGKGVKADQVLATYQVLYEARIVSYPRTDDKTITTAQFTELLPFVNKIAGVVGVSPGILSHRVPRKTHVKDGGAHGANRPGPEVPESLDFLKSKYGPIAPLIYEELARSYLAMLAEDYLYESQDGHVEKYPLFVGRASVPKSQGWKAVFFDVDDDAPAKPGAEAADAASSANTKGLGTNADPIIYEIVPPRPEHPSMKWLMKQLEKRDVGTGATRTSTYAEVTSEKAKFPLLSDKRGKITMTEHGDMSYRLLPGTRIGDLGLTEQVYATMRDIAAGKTTAAAALVVVADWVREDIKTMQRNAVSMRKDLGLSEQTQTQQKEKTEGVWSETGEVTKFNKEWGGHTFTDAEVDKLLAGLEISFKATSKSGNEYSVAGVLASQVFEKDGKSHPFIGFKPDFGPKKDAKGIEQPQAAWCSHTFTMSEVKQLVDGEKIFIDDFVSKAGKSFGATVHFGEEAGKPGKKIIPEFG